MTDRQRTKIIREAEYVAEVDVQVTDAAEPWGPYLSSEDTRKLDAVRSALRRGDIAAAQRFGRVYRLTLIGSGTGAVD
jgi:hypothetical protein